MKVALVHDYLKEYGGAERVLSVLSELFPEAPIYTAFYVKNSPGGQAFKSKKIITSGLNTILQLKNLYSPLRFLTPLIWGSFDLSAYDLVITSSSWYITRGFKVGKNTKVICYCHTPPRWLYGYQTGSNLQKFWPVRLYGQIMAHFLRQYDFQTAQSVNYFITNSENTKERIKKFYRRDSTVIYPPVCLMGMLHSPASNFYSESNRGSNPSLNDSSKNWAGSPHAKDIESDYFLVVSRLAAAKNIDIAIKACNELKENLVIVGSGGEEEYLRSIAGPTIKFLGQVSDSELWKIYSGCKALICTATDEDFGITPVEAMAAGRPVIAYRGGGYLETTVEGKTGEFFDECIVDSLSEKLKNFKTEKYSSDDCRNQAEKFSKEVFKENILEFIKEKVG